MVVLCFSTQEKDICECTSGKCHVLPFSMQEDLHYTLKSSVICIHFNQFVNVVELRHPPHNIMEHTHAKILVSTLVLSVTRQYLR